MIVLFEGKGIQTDRLWGESAFTRPDVSLSILEGILTRSIRQWVKRLTLQSLAAV